MCKFLNNPRLFIKIKLQKNLLAFFVLMDKHGRV
jgi:hypothetical protein